MQWAAHFGAWIPALWLAADYATDNLTANPIQAATQRAGKTAMVLLMLSLACTPLGNVFGFRPALKVRRTLGLYAFLYAAGHFLLFSGVDYRFNLAFIWADAGKKPFIWVGLSAGLILLALAATSFRWGMRRLGKNWKRLHRLVYLAGALVMVHFAWAKKGDALALRGDILQPLLFAGLFGLLLLLRIPPARRWIKRRLGSRSG